MSQTAEALEVIADVPCQTCGYNLRGLRSDGRCPECGANVQPSLSAPPPLAMASSPWICSVRHGAILTALGYGIIIMVAIGLSLADSEIGFILCVLAALPGAILLAQGGNCLGGVESHTFDDAPLLRPVVRWSGSAFIVTLLFIIVAQDPIIIMPAICLIANQVSTALYSGILARRIPARIVASLTTVIFALHVACWTGLFIAVVFGEAKPICALLACTACLSVACMSALLAVMPKTGRAEPKPWSQCITGPISTRK